jgi:hypothetical protein
MTCVISEALVKDIGRSDHASFWRYGYSVLMVTDTVPFRNPPQQGTLNSPCKLASNWANRSGVPMSIHTPR